MPKDKGGKTPLLGQPDLGGGQLPRGGRPRGTAPVGRFAEEGAGGAWPTAPGEVEGAAEEGAAEEGAAEEGVPGSGMVRREDAAESNFPGGSEPETRRGALYDGPERRRAQAAWERWEHADRRTRPFVYAGQQRV